jgi:hypothetical protein
MTTGQGRGARSIGIFHTSHRNPLASAAVPSHNEDVPAAGPVARVPPTREDR